MVQETVFDDARSPDVFFVGGLQVDRRGNINLFGIPDGDGGWKVRGPGGVALCDDEHQLRRLLHRHAAPRRPHLRRAGRR